MTSPDDDPRQAVQDTEPEDAGCAAGLGGRAATDGGPLPAEDADPVHEARGREDGRSFTDWGTGIGVVVFALGLACGVPVALFAPNLIDQHGGTAFAAILIVLVAAALTLAILYLLRGPIFRWLLRRIGVEVRDLSAPLSELARHAAARRLPETTAAARNLAELAIARFLWLSSRRWLVASITALVAAVAALAGSALLFEQNRLLRNQSELLTGQNQRIDEQSELLRTQNSLAEAERNAVIVSQLIELAERMAGETGRLPLPPGAKPGDPPVHFLDELSPDLRAGLVAASNAARPYRFLRSAIPDSSDHAAMLHQALRRRAELPKVARLLGMEDPAAVDSSLVDRPLSPERGMILTLLRNHGIRDTEGLSFSGADFTAAEVRNTQLELMSLRHASLGYASFDHIPMQECQFGGAFLQLARFRHGKLKHCVFSSLPAGEVRPPYRAEAGMPLLGTQLAGADFGDAILFLDQFEDIQGLAMNFDRAVISGCNFDRATLAASTFRQSVLYATDFDGADLHSVDFDGAIVFEADFLERLQAQASPGNFRRELFVQEAVSAEEFARHPNYNNFNDEIPAEAYADGHIWRVRRIADFP